VKALRVEHELKCWPDFFVPVLTGMKTFEVRKNDRNFKLGDVLWLREWDPHTEMYTGNSVRAKVVYILHDFGLEDGYVVMGIRIEALA
jgi:hypothetical protein